MNELKKVRLFWCLTLIFAAGAPTCFAARYSVDNKRLMIWLAVLCVLVAFVFLYLKEFYENEMKKKQIFSDLNNFIKNYKYVTIIFDDHQRLKKYEANKVKSFKTEDIKIELMEDGVTLTTSKNQFLMKITIGDKLEFLENNIVIETNDGLQTITVWRGNE